MKKSVGVVLVSLLCGAASLQAADFYVDKSSAHAVPPYATWFTAAHSIQSAVARAAAGDTVWVNGGGGTLVYTGSNVGPDGMVNVVVLTKDVTVMGVGNPIIDGGAATRGVYLSAGQLRGFTIRKGAAHSGGGAYIVGGELRNSIVVSNNATLGGGIFFSGGKAINCLIARNASAGVIFDNGGSLVNCTVVGSGIGIYMQKFASVINCVVWSNSTNWRVSAGDPANSVTFFRNNCTTPDYTGPGDVAGNTTSHPRFLDYAGGNYRLGQGTLCLNGGFEMGGLDLGSTDLDGNPRIVARVDMGAYETPAPGWPDPDAYEPDDSKADASAIANGETQTHSIHGPLLDEDWVKFTVGSGGARNVQVETDGASGDTYVGVFDGSLQRVGYDDDSGNGAFSLVTLPSLPAGTYYIKVESSYGWLSAYTLQASWTGAEAAGDAYEMDNSAATAKKTENGQTQNRSIHAEGNQDWARFTIGSGGARNVRVETDGNGGGDTQMSVFGPNSSTKLVDYDDDGGGGNFSLIKAATLPAGKYYIQISEFNNDGTISAYTLKASWTAANGPASDAYERDNVSAAAKKISNGKTQNRSIHVAGNKDWAKFTVGGLGAANVRLETAGAVGDTQLRLYAQNGARTGAGTQLAYNNNGGVGAFSRIKLFSLPPGTYYVRVTESGNNGTIPAYTLKATWTGL